MDFRKLLTVPEAAAILSVSLPRAYELIRKDILPAVHLGRQVRVCGETLEKWISNGGQQT